MRTTQYGVQIVWADPVKAGAVKSGEVYLPQWHAFDSAMRADLFAARYLIDRDVAVVNRATRWAVEEYGLWKPDEPNSAWS